MLIECECLVKLPQQTDKLHHAPLRGVHFRSQHTLGRQCGETLFALGGNVEIHRCSEACEKAPRHLAESRRELLGGLDSLVWKSLQRSRERGQAYRKLGQETQVFAPGTEAWTHECIGAGRCL